MSRLLVVVGVLAGTLALPASVDAEVAEISCAASATPSIVGPGDSTTIALTVEPDGSLITQAYLWNGVEIVALPQNVSSLTSQISYEALRTTVTSLGVTEPSEGNLTVEFRDEGTPLCSFTVSLVADGVSGATCSVTPTSSTIGPGQTGEHDIVVSPDGAVFTVHYLWNGTELTTFTISVASGPTLVSYDGLQTTLPGLGVSDPQSGVLVLEFRRAASTRCSFEVTLDAAFPPAPPPPIPVPATYTG